MENSIVKVNNWLNEISYDQRSIRLAHLPADVVAQYYNISDFHEMETEGLWFHHNNIRICTMCNSIPTDDNVVYMYGSANTRSIHSVLCHQKTNSFVKTKPYIIRMSEHTTAVIHPDYMKFHLQGSDKHEIVRNIPILDVTDNFMEINNQVPYLEQPSGFPEAY